MLRIVLPWIAIITLLGLLLAVFAPILTPFFLAFIFAYLLTPGVDWLRRHRVPVGIAAVLMILLLVISLVLLFLLMLSVLQHEMPVLREQIPALLVRLNGMLAPKLAELGINLRLDFPELQKILREHIASSPDDMVNRISQTLLFSGATLINLVTIVIFVPLLLFYLLQDWHVLNRHALRFVPPRWHASVVGVSSEINVLLSQYLRGQLWVMVILSVYYTSALFLAGFDVALPIGLFTGLAVFIPYIGFTIGLILALLTALLQFGDAHGVLVVAGIYGFGQIVESFFLTPVLVGERIGLHPLAVIFALLAFGQLFGFLGILLALPASAVILVLLRHLNRAYHASNFYR